ncbi:MAG: hypothetical protein ACOYOP_09005 [Microthrixaceae bacterium]
MDCGPGPGGTGSTGADGEAGPVCFVHVMKTAGRALADVIARPLEARSPGSTMVGLTLDDFVRLPDDTWAHIRFLSGHLSFEALELLPASTTAVTVLRDPVERTLSHYSHLRAAPEVRAEWGDLTLAEFLTHERWRDLVADYQARHLGHRIGLVDAHRTFAPEERFGALGPPFPPTHSHPLQSLFDCGPAATRDELRPVALANLASVDVVGTTEQLDRIAHDVADRLGLGRRTVQHLHATPERLRRQQVDRGLLRLIGELTELDEELVELARQGGVPPTAVA